MQQAQDSELVQVHVVHEHVVILGHEFARASFAPQASYLGMPPKQRRFPSKDLVEFEGRLEILWSDVVENRVAVSKRDWGPLFHRARRAYLRRAAARFLSK